MGFIGTWIITALATMATISIVPGIEVVGDSYMGPAMFALALALVNAIIKPVAEVLSLPINFLTFGLFSLVVNAFMLQIASGVSVSLFGSGISIDSFGAAFIGSIVITLVSTVLNSVMGS